MVYEITQPLFDWAEKPLNVTGFGTKLLLPAAAGFIGSGLLDIVAGSGLGAKLMKVGTGLGTIVLTRVIPQTAGMTPATLKEESLVSSAVLGAMALGDLRDIASGLEQIKRALGYGDWTTIAKVLGFKSPEEITAEIKAALDNIGRSLNIALPMPSFAPATGALASPTVTVPARRMQAV